MLCPTSHSASCVRKTRLGDGNLIDLHETLATEHKLTDTFQHASFLRSRCVFVVKTWLNFNESQLSCCRDHWHHLALAGHKGHRHFFPNRDCQNSSSCCLNTLSLTNSRCAERFNARRMRAIFPGVKVRTQGTGGMTKNDFERNS